MLGTINLISKRYHLMAVGPEKCLWYRNGRLWVSSELDDRVMEVADDLYIDEKQHILGRIIINNKLLQRILRLQPRACVMNDVGQFCFSFNRRIYIVDQHGRIIDSTPVRDGKRNPLQIAWIQGISGFRDALVYGEYGWDTSIDCVNIMQYGNHRWNTVYSFPPGTVSHIHGLVPDPKNQCVYVLTGDADSESGIWKAEANFSKVTPVLTGKQIYRCCAARVREDGMIYATDTPITNNYLMRIGRDWETKQIASLPGSVINSMEGAECWWFSTAVEQNPNLPRLLHSISIRKGPGIIDRNIHVFQYDDERGLHEVVCLKKDWLPMWLFQFGNLSFVRNYRNDRVFAIPIATTQWNLMTIEIKT